MFQGPNLCHSLFKQRYMNFLRLPTFANKTQTSNLRGENFAGSNLGGFRRCSWSVSGLLIVIEFTGQPSIATVAQFLVTSDLINEYLQIRWSILIDPCVSARAICKRILRASRKRVLRHVPEHYRADREVLLAAAARNASCICLADPALQTCLLFLLFLIGASGVYGRFSTHLYSLYIYCKYIYIYRYAFRHLDMMECMYKIYR